MKAKIRRSPLSLLTKMPHDKWCFDVQVYFMTNFPYTFCPLADDNSQAVLCWNAEAASQKYNANNQKRMHRRESIVFTVCVCCCCFLFSSKKNTFVKITVGEKWNGKITAEKKKNPRNNVKSRRLFRVSQQKRFSHVLQTTINVSLCTLN